MEHNSEIYHRRSIRLKDYDYSQPGAYFFTICSQNRECLFGEIVGANGIRPISETMGSEMVLNECGIIVREEWLRTSEIRHEIALDEFVIMPNHFHAIIIITDSRKIQRGDGETIKGDRLVAPTRTIGRLIAGYKSVVTKRINTIRLTPGFPVWQRSYYEHVIRDETELNKIRQYIINNPLEWASDRDNPAYK